MIYLNNSPFLNYKKIKPITHPYIINTNNINKKKTTKKTPSQTPKNTAKMNTQANRTLGLIFNMI